MPRTAGNVPALARELIATHLVLRQVTSEISKRLYRQVSQSVCPWNQKFSQGLADDSPFAPRTMFFGKDARTVARDLLAMSQEEFSVAFKGSPTTRAKLRGLKRNAAVVLGNVGTPDDIPLLVAALDHDDLLFREHSAWARGALSPTTPVAESDE